MQDTAKRYTLEEFIEARRQMTEKLKELKAEQNSLNIRINDIEQALNGYNPIIQNQF